jgi:DNA-binding response OmpR family regulator
MADHDTIADHCVAIVHAAGLDSGRWSHLMTFTRHEDRRMMLVSGANTPEARTTVLANGFGDAVADHTSLEELEARARRLAEQASWVPRKRVLATLELDLIAREATYRGKPLNLHPREFALLWRLADTPDEPVSKTALTHDVLPIGFAPESNSIAVHLSRLRAKLTAAGLAGLIETSRGGYRLCHSVIEAEQPEPWMRSATARRTVARGGR